MRGPNSLRVSISAPRTSGRRRVDCAPARIYARRLRSFLTRGQPFRIRIHSRIMRGGGLMEFMQTGRRRWGRPTRVRSPTRGPARLCIQDQRESLATPGARNVRDSEAYSRRRPGTSPGRPSASGCCYPPSSVAGAVWIFQRHRTAFEGSVSWICTSNQPQSLSPPASRIAISIR